MVTLRAGGSWRSSTAEKRYLEGEEEEEDGIADWEELGTEVIFVCGS